MKKAILTLCIILIAGTALSANVSLVKNHCSPVGCEQVYRISSFSEFSITPEAYKIEAEQITGNFPEGRLELYFGTEINATKQTEVYSTECDAVKDKNGDTFLGNCSQVLDYIKNETAKNVFWEKGIYGKQILSGKVHYIKVKLETRPWETFKADIIPTIDNIKYKEWAWWDNNWDYKQKITMQTDTIGLSGNVTTDHLVLVDVNSDNSDFWTTIQNDGDDVRFANAAETTEYAYYFQDFNYTGQKMLAWVLVTDTFTSGADTEFYMYYGNAGASLGEQVSTALANLETIYHADDFDTGTDLNSANYDYNATLSNTAAWNTATPKLGNSSIYFNNAYNAVQGTLLDVVPANFTISLWFRPDATFNEADTDYLFDKYTVWTSDFFQSYFNADGTLSVYGKNGGTVHNVHTSQSSWAANTWFYLFATWSTTYGLVVYINGDVSGSDPAATTLLSNGSAKDFYFGDDQSGISKFNGYIDEIKLYNTDFSASDANLMYNIETGSIITFGTEESNVTTATPDLNMVSIEGHNSIFPFFSYQGDGNLSIDFNVFEPAGNMRLLLDINYGLNAGETSIGDTVIYNDLNLTSDICPVQDWDEEASECSIDFNTIGIGDNNFYIKMSISASTGNPDYNEMGDFAIDNNAPTIAAYYPATATGTSSSSVLFSIESNSDYSGAYRAFGGFLFNGSLDYNETQDFNSGSFAGFTYNVLFALNDEVCLVVNSLSDNAGNISDISQKTACFTRNVLTPVNQESVTSENVEKGAQYMFYSIFTKFGAAAGFIVIFVLVCFLVFFLIKGVTRS